MTHYQDFYKKLRQLMSGYFDLDELRQLAFDLNVDWDEVAGEAKSTKIVVLVGMLERNGRLAELMTALQAQRPQVNWPELLVEAGNGRADIPLSSLATGPDLSGAVMRWANLGGADLSRANLRGVDLRWAELYQANLSEADLRGADLRRAKMRKANFSRANLKGARLDGADLRLANLTGAAITMAELAQARKLNGAVMPSGQLYDPARPLSEQMDGR